MRPSFRGEAPLRNDRLSMCRSSQLEPKREPDKRAVQRYVVDEIAIVEANNACVTDNRLIEEILGMAYCRVSQ